MQTREQSLPRFRLATMSTLLHSILTRVVFNSNGEGTITVIHQDTVDKYSVFETVQDPAQGQDHGVRFQNASVVSVYRRERAIRNSSCWKIGGEKNQFRLEGLSPRSGWVIVVCTAPPDSRTAVLVK